MRRKLIKQGKDTLTATLPKSWIRKYGIVVGDEVDVDEQDRVLVISIDKGVAAPRTAFDVDNLDANMIWRLFVSAYRSGYDEVQITFDDLRKKYTQEPFTSHTYSDERNIHIVEFIQGMVNRFVGVEIIDQKTTYCLVKDVMRIDQSEFDNAFRRIFLLLLSLSNDCAVALKDCNKEAFSSIDVTDSNIDRFTDFCLRIINKKGYKDYRKSSIMYSIVLMLESAGDEYKRFSKMALKVDKPSQKILNNLKRVNELLRQYYELFYKHDVKKMNNFHMSLYNEVKSLEVQIDDVRREEKLPFLYLLRIVRLLIDLVQLKLDFEA